MLWVLFTDKILATDKPGILILMFMSATINIFICHLVSVRCKNKRLQNERFGGKQVYVQPDSADPPRHTSPPPPPTSGSNIVKASTRISVRNNHNVIINGNYNTVNITGTDVWIASEHRKEKQ